MTSERSFANGAPFLLTQIEKLGSGSVRYHYLMPDGARHAIIVSQAVDNDGLRERIGMMLASGGRVVKSSGRG